MWTKRKAIKEAQNAIISYKDQKQALHEELAVVNKENQENTESLSQSYRSLAQELIGKSVSKERIEKVATGLSLPRLNEVLDNLEIQRANVLTERNELIKQSAFKKMWKFVTLKSHKESKYIQIVEASENTSLQETVIKYEKKVQFLEQQTDIYNEVDGRYQTALSLIKRFDSLCEWEGSYENIANDHLLDYLSPVIKDMADTALMDKMPRSLATHVGTIAAKRKKTQYYLDLASYLENEIFDRDQRISSISRVRNKWRRNPSGFVRGDKSKWLNSIPEMKRGGTRKRIGWSSSMRNSMCGFHSYSHYSDHMYAYHYHDHRSDFLAYDIFNSYSSTRMPYDGFSSSVINEVSEFRESSGDASWLDQEAIAAEDIEQEAEWIEELEDDTTEDAALEAITAEAEEFENIFEEEFDSDNEDENVEDIS